MRTTLVAAALLCGLGMGCSKSDSEAPASEAPEATTGSEASGTEGAPTTESVLATQPDAIKVKTQVTKLTYPATRDQVLAATMSNPEFTASERKYMEDNLPDGSYASPDEVLNALKVQ
jgi:hypothetical protein